MYAKLITIVISLILVVIVYRAGYKPASSNYTVSTFDIPGDPAALDNFIAEREARVNTKPDNHARIVWASEKKEKTPYAVVYLHGFSGSYYDGYPVNTKFAKRFGINMYLPRLYAHGLEGEKNGQTSLLKLNADDYWKSALFAVQVAERLGDNVIIMATSAGAMLALNIAAQYSANIAALIMMSPAVRIANPAAFFLNKHWGLHIARAVYGGKTTTATTYDPTIMQYWNRPYRLEALTALQQMIEDTMRTRTFSRITVPAWVGVYYKDKANQDSVVSVAASQKMWKNLGTADELKQFTEFPDAGEHAIGAQALSSAHHEVSQSINTFAETVLHLVPVDEQ